MVRDIIRLIRPKHWIKNLFVFPPLLFSFTFFDLPSVFKALVIFIAFCFTASAVYAFNDIFDRHRDRMHPEKKHRPVAAGRISVRQALVTGIFLALGGISVALTAGPAAAGIVAAYLALHLLYGLFLKNQILIDVMVIAAGFLLRVGAGAAALGVDLSQWMLMSTFFLSLFLGFGKRRKELLVTHAETSHRAVFKDYSLEFLDHLILISASLTIIAYSLYVVTSLEGGGFFITIPFVVFGIFRYLLLIYRRNMGDDPADMVFSDTAMIIDILLWGATLCVLLGLSLVSGGSG